MCIRDRIGTPQRPISMYTPTDSAPYFGPSTIPARVVNNSCSVKGTKGTGILINAPTAIKAANNAHKIREYTVDFDFSFMKRSPP